MGDMKRIKWNPYNTDANLAAQLNKISFYKGSAVVRQNFMNGTGALITTGLGGVAVC